MTRFLMVPEAQMREMEARIDEERTFLREMQAQMAARLEATERMAYLYQQLLAGAGDVNFPAGSLALELQPSVRYTPAPPIPRVVERVPYNADRQAAPDVAQDATPQAEPQQSVALNAGPGTGSTTPGKRKYRVNRGGRPTYADVIALEVPHDEFHIIMAWAIIGPLLETQPRNWRRSLRRSLDNEKDPRFEPIPGREDWYRRVRGAELLDDVVEDGDDEDEDQTYETASGVGASETVSEDWRG